MSQQQIRKTFRGLRPGDPDGRNGFWNPERGFRFEIGVGKTASTTQKFTHVTDHWPVARYKTDGVTIAQAYCYLTQYHDSPIGDDVLQQLQADFDRARRDGIKFLLRFAYEYDGAPYGPTLDRLMQHMAQLKDIIRKNIDVIYVLQTGWLGLWGEFHSSALGLEKDPDAVAKIMTGTLELLPESRFTMMRCMRYRTAALEKLGDLREITEDTAFTNAPHARIGFFNDGTLANYWDGGTFFDPPHSAPGNPEFDGVAKEGYFMPVDGELFWTGQYSSPEDATGILAIERFTHHHYTTFSLVHGFSELDQNPEKWTIDTWKEQQITPELLKEHAIRFDPDYFAGVSSRSAFEFIRDHLGYRLAMPEACFDAEAERNIPFTASVVLQNTGFATMINSRNPEFVLLGKEQIVELPADTDCRKLQPAPVHGKRDDVLRHTITYSAPLPEHISAGEYELAFWLPDAEASLRYRPDYAVRLATNVETRIVDGRLLHILGKITVK